MKIIIRCDASFEMGTGHVIRCLNLAEKLKLAQNEIAFSCRELPGNLIALIKEKKFEVFSLPQSERFNLEEEFTQFLAVSTKFGADWIIVDHYQLDQKWEEKIVAKGFKLFVIDDILRNHNCQGILDQNLHPEERTVVYQAPERSVFLGPHYALLSLPFLTIVPRKRNFSEVTNIMVFFGGADAVGETLRFLKLIPQMSEKLFFNIVVGGGNPKLQEIRTLAASIKNLALHVQTDRMAELINESDLYIGAAGSITWERCSLGLPGICVSVANNQVEVAHYLHEKRVHYYLGKHNEIKDQDYVNSLCSLMAKPLSLKEFSENSLKLKISQKVSLLIDFFK